MVEVVYLTDAMGKVVTQGIHAYTAEEQYAMSIWQERLNTESMMKVVLEAAISYQQTGHVNEGKDIKIIFPPNTKFVFYIYTY